MVDLRERKGREIAARLRIERDGDGFRVPSQTSKAFYHVALGSVCTCTCPDWELRRGLCKHIRAVFDLLEYENCDPPPVPDEPTPRTRKTYTQDWPKYKAAMRNEKADFRVLLHDLCRRLATPRPTSKGGRPKVLLSDIVFAMVFKVYSTSSFLRFDSDLRDAHHAGFVTALHHPNSVGNYLAAKSTTAILQQLIGITSAPVANLLEAAGK